MSRPPHQPHPHPSAPSAHPHPSEDTPWPSSSSTTPPPLNLATRIATSASSLARDTISNTTNPHDITSALASSNAAAAGSQKSAAGTGVGSSSASASGAVVHGQHYNSPAAAAGVAQQFRSRGAAGEAGMGYEAFGDWMTPCGEAVMGNGLMNSRWDDYAYDDAAVVGSSSLQKQEQEQEKLSDNAFEQSWITSAHAIGDVQTHTQKDGAAVVDLLSFSGGPLYTDDLLASSFAEVADEPSAADLFGSDVEDAPAFARLVASRLPPSASGGVGAEAGAGAGLEAYNLLTTLLSTVQTDGQRGREQDEQHLQTLYAEWDRAFRHYTDEVWGPYHPELDGDNSNSKEEKEQVLQEARSAFEDVVGSGFSNAEQGGMVREKAVRRLEMVLAHVRMKAGGGGGG